MEFAEKLRRLLEGRKLKDVLEQAKLGRSVLSKYLTRKSRPSADAALRLSQALGVDLSWLVNDNASWPPQSLGKPSVEAVADADLIRELARRARRDLLSVRRMVEEMQAFDWAGEVRRLAALPIEKLTEKPLAADKGEWVHSWLYHLETAYNPWFYAQLYGSEMPGPQFEDHEIDPHNWEEKVYNWERSNPWYKLYQELEQLNAASAIASPTDLERRRAEILKKIADLDAQNADNVS